MAIRLGTQLLTGTTGSTSTGTTVEGTADEIDVTTVDDTATVSLDSVVTTAISTNTSGIATNVTDIATNTSAIASLGGAVAGTFGITAGVDVDYSWELTPPGGAGTTNYDVYTTAHGGSINGFMRFYTNNALSALGFYTGGTGLVADANGSTLVFCETDLNGLSFPTPIDGTAFVMRNAAGDEWTSEWTNVVPPADFPVAPNVVPAGITAWRTGIATVPAGFPAANDTLNINWTITVTGEDTATAGQVFGQGVIIISEGVGYMKTSAGTLTTTGTNAELPSVDTAGDWSQITA